MAPDALNELLDAVPPSRRHFLKTILTGTAFAAPLMASFSMDGLSIEAAAQGLPGNMTSNQSPADFVQDALSFANMTPTKKPRRYRARLLDTVSGRFRGELDLLVNDQRHAIEYRLTLTGGAPLETVNFGHIGLPAAVLVIQTPAAEYGLTMGRGEIGVTAGNVTHVIELVNAFEFGEAHVVVKTTMFRAEGEVEPR